VSAAEAVFKAVAANQPLMAGVVTHGFTGRNIFEHVVADFKIVHPGKLERDTRRRISGIGKGASAYEDVIGLCAATPAIVYAEQTPGMYGVALKMKVQKLQVCTADKLPAPGNADRVLLVPGDDDPFIRRAFQVGNSLIARIVSGMQVNRIAGLKHRGRSLDVRVTLIGAQMDLGLEAGGTQKA